MAGSIKQGLLGVEAASTEQESNNPSVVLEFAKSELQPQKVVVDKELLVRIVKTLKDQMSEFINKIEELTKAKANQWTLAVVPVTMAKDRKRMRGHTWLLGELHFSFELIETCIPGNIDLDKVLLLTQSGEEISDGNYPTPKLSVSERLRKWHLQQTKGMTTDVYYYHYPSDQTFRSEDEVVQFVLDETCPPKHSTGSKVRKVVKAIESTQLVEDVVIRQTIEATLGNQGPSSSSNASTIAERLGNEIETGKMMSTEEMLNEFSFAFVENENYI